jgi:hypothetical protein
MRSLDRYRDSPGGFAVRVDWTDGSHTLECYTTNFHAASRERLKMLAYWQRGPGPRAWATELLAVSREVWDEHRKIGRCRATDCTVSV